jgi:hypothetical protein
MPESDLALLSGAIPVKERARGAMRDLCHYLAFIAEFRQIILEAAGRQR